MRILPDGLTGALMAAEGIKDARAILHGPGGCRLFFMHCSVSAFPRMGSSGTAEYNIPFFFGQSRIPSSYLDEQDYINGAYGKITEVLPVVSSKGAELFVIVNSPGAALIGDNHPKAIRSCGLENKAMFVDESLISIPFTAGYDHMLTSIMAYLHPPKKLKIPKTVNLIGLSIMDKDWMSAKSGLTELLEAMGLQVTSCPGAGCTIQELHDSVSAELNVVVCPEMCSKLVQFYKNNYGIPFCKGPMGAPIGFAPIKKWLTTVAEMTNADPQPALEIVRSHEGRVFNKFIGFPNESSRLRGMTMSVAAPASVARALTEWLYDYIGFIPITVLADPGSDPSESELLRIFLSDHGLTDSWNKELSAQAEVTFCDHNTAEILSVKRSSGITLDIGAGSNSQTGILPRPIYGPMGALHILDEIICNLRRSESN